MVSTLTYINKCVNALGCVCSVDSLDTRDTVCSASTTGCDKNSEKSHSSYEKSSHLVLVWMVSSYTE